MSDTPATAARARVGARAAGRLARGGTAKDARQARSMGAGA
jgi:hypothetical protein